MQIKILVMKRLDPLSWFIIFGLFLMAVLFTYFSCVAGHQCKYKECPYKGVTADLAHRSVSAYVGEVYTDAYYLDILHLQYPNEDYEQLENRLTNTQK